MQAELEKLRELVAHTQEQEDRQATAQWEVDDARRHVEELEEEMEQQKEQTEYLKVQVRQRSCGFASNAFVGVFVLEFLCTASLKLSQSSNKILLLCLFCTATSFYLISGPNTLTCKSGVRSWSLISVASGRYSLLCVFRFAP